MYVQYINIVNIPTDASLIRLRMIDLDEICGDIALKYGECAVTLYKLVNIRFGLLDGVRLSPRIKAVSDTARCI